MAVFEKEFKNFFDIVTRLNLISAEEQKAFEPYFAQLSNNKLYVVLYDRKHDVNHAIRCALYTHLLCTKKNVEKKYYDYVMMAAIYHDSGLDRTKPKEMHGVDGAQLFEKYNKDKYDPKDLEIIKRLIALHASESNELDISGLNIRSKKIIANLNLIYKILKDADAIDRNRLDYSFTKCKPRSLRIPISKSLLEVADNVLFEYKKKEYVMPGLTDSAKFEYYYKIYVNFAKKYLPVKNEVIAKNLTNSLKIESELGERAKELFRVPAILFYGSNSMFELIKDKSDTAANFHLICSDSPLQSFFRTVFQNDVEIGISVNEYFDENGDYIVKYFLDEYVKGAIERTITNRKITIHVLDGNMFYKATEDRYNTRDWTSRNYRKIYAMDKFEVDVASFFNALIESKVLSYSPWSVGKEIPNIVNIVRKSYLPRLKTDIDMADNDLDDVITKYYPNQREFVGYFREDVKGIMDSFGRLSDANFDDRAAEVEEFIKEKLQAKNSQDQYVFSAKKINDYLSEKRESGIVVDSKTGRIVKVVTEEDLTLPETEEVEIVEENPMKGYIAMIVLAAVIGILIGGVIAVVHYFIVR